MPDALKPWTAVTAVVLLVLACMAIGWGTNGWRMSAGIAEAHKVQAVEREASARAAMVDLVEGASKVRTAADSHDSERATIVGKLDQLSKDF
ncbi:hypothetical protein PPN31114_03105 [Pandoraea pneumonica]|jgi:alpha-D-ribose 1-methylphosphonate 5-phosphate C-P lyase|uniref:Uncharacterized protein n=1 Tax=Pandoraea pneumonica TaxID=2508299 RepID=A0A5E4W7L5_9BURK|nr:hypothetical protein [Pandoraea pneumonica]VVE20093.1 hypothetical protein PPN31114_03105 [Pandoraea pneumonica]